MFLISESSWEQYAVRQVKKRAGEIQAGKLLEASEAGSMELLKEMKRIKGGKKTTLDLPENVAGACREINIVAKFREFYEGVYNSSESNEAVNEIKIKISELLTDVHGAHYSSVELSKLSGDMVKQAACKMKPKKGDVSESYTSDAILNAPDLLFDLLALSLLALSLLACAFLPLVG